MKTKICTKCKQEKSLDEFYTHVEFGHQSLCKACKKIENKKYSERYQAEGYYVKRLRTYGQIPEVKARKHAREKRYREDPRIRIKSLARWYTNRQIRDGKLNREPCALCGVEQGQAHHTDYNQPLLIAWLCRNCHWRVHSNLREVSDGKQRHIL